MRHIPKRWITGAIFVLFVAAGALAMTAAYLILGRMIIAAGNGDAGPLAVIASGSVVGTLTAFVIHELSRVLPGVMQQSRAAARE